MGDAGPSSPSLLTGRAGLPSANPTESFWQTSHPNTLADHRSTAALPDGADVVVIGTGISGTFATHELLTRAAAAAATDTDHAALDVVVLEARTTCSAATGRNGGHCQPLVHAERSAIIDFEMRNYEHIRELVERHDVPCDFRRIPGVLGFWNRTYFDEAKAALDSALVTAEHRSLVKVVEGPEELERLRLTGGVVGAIVQTVAASLSPYKLMVWLWDRMVQEYEREKKSEEGGGGGGARPPTKQVTLNLQTNTPVTSIEKVQGGDGGVGWTVKTSRGNVRAKHVVLATNGYTSHLVPEFEGLISPVQAQMSALLPPDGSPFREHLMPVSYGMMGVEGQDRVMSDYLVQNPILPPSGEDVVAVGRGGHLMFGGGRAQARGHGVGVSDDDYVDADAEIYLRSLPERLNLVEAGASTAAGTSKGGLLDIAASWTGIIGSSADGHPWVGGVPDQDGLFVAAGYSGHGMTNAALCGRHVAQLALTSLNEGRDWKALQAQGVELAEQGNGGGGGVPREYVITQQRMDAARGPRH
ncbi:hypothetical protein LTS17_002365 [Exophiala oligosperma]